MEKERRVETERERRGCVPALRVCESVHPRLKSSVRNLDAFWRVTERRRTHTHAHTERERVSEERETQRPTSQ